MSHYLPKGRELLAFGYCRSCDEILIPQSIVLLLMDWLYLIEFMPFSNEYKDDVIVLSTDNKFAYHTDSGHNYVLCEMDGISSGTHMHCFRVFVNDPEGYWSFWGISGKKKSGGLSTFSSKAYGMQTHGDVYTNGSLAGYTESDTEGFRLRGHKEICIDMLLQCDQSRNDCDELSICCVGTEHASKIQKWQKMIRPKGGWVLHFNLCVRHTSICVVRIPLALFKQSDDALTEFSQQHLVNSWPNRT
eukprot:601216_1